MSKVYCHVTMPFNLLLNANKGMLRTVSHCNVKDTRAKKKKRNCSLCDDRLNQNNHDNVINVKFIALEVCKIKFMCPKILITKLMKLITFKDGGLI